MKLDLLPDLSERAVGLTELMEDRRADAKTVFRTLRQFLIINGAVARWRRAYRSCLLPRMCDRRRSYRLLDIGFGGGDVACAIARWARRSGLDLSITAVDRDPRCLAFVRRRRWPPGVRFLHGDHHQLLLQKRRFDFVISNHTLHHFEPIHLRCFLEEAAQLANDTVLLSDIERSRLAYAAFGLLTAPFFHGSFVVRDGLMSIRRSYRGNELVSIVPPGWEIRTLFPWRLLVVHHRNV